MLRINQLKLSPDHTEKDLLAKISKMLRLEETKIKTYRIRKQSIDARDQADIKYIYTVDVRIGNEIQWLKSNHNKQIEKIEKKSYRFPECGSTQLSKRPVVVGSGPAGLFCSYLLAEAGFRPIMLERGGDVDERTADVEHFWKDGVLNLESNVQFGEGGAGTFSDGKLNTLVKDKWNRNQKVLEVLVEHGAPEVILYESKPHIGTDVLTTVVKNMRNHMIQMGGEVRFHSKVTDIQISNGTITGVKVNEDYLLESSIVVFAIGHSARDTFECLQEKHVPMEAKAFAIGVRIEHTQDMIQESQYGKVMKDQLPPASYKLATQLGNGRGVYSFCMCPGGYVVNASSEQNRLAVNGMSYRDRNGVNANSAIVVTVTPDDFASKDSLAGIAYQRDLEEKAFQIGEGQVPVQCFKDYVLHEKTTTLGRITPQIKGTYRLANVRSIFAKEIGDAIEQGIKEFDRKIKGFAMEDAVISGVESRTSSPVRILRDSNLESSVKGLYPAGEGAGYAGGIVSASMDGMKVAEAIAVEFSLKDEISF